MIPVEVFPTHAIVDYTMYEYQYTLPSHIVKIIMLLRFSKGRTLFLFFLIDYVALPLLWIYK